MICDFFLIYLPSQRESSPRTVKVYQTAIEQLVEYVAGQKECRITAVTFDMLDNNLISAFLNDMELCVCSVSTRNHKHKPIRALFAYAAVVDFTPTPYYLELENITWKKVTGHAGIEFLSEAGMKALLAQLDTSTKKGIRNLLLMM